MLLRVRSPWMWHYKSRLTEGHCYWWLDFMNWWVTQLSSEWNKAYSPLHLHGSYTPAKVIIYFDCQIKLDKRPDNYRLFLIYMNTIWDLEGHDRPKTRCPHVESSHILQHLQLWPCLLNTVIGNLFVGMEKASKWLRGSEMGRFAV